jgi:hypothetical protein
MKKKHPSIKTKKMQGEETITILYNTRFGGWTPNENVLTLYNNRMKEINPAFSAIMYFSDIERHDSVLVQLYQELGSLFDSDEGFSETHGLTIPAKYTDYYAIENFDGYEDVVVLKDKWTLDQVEKLLETASLTSEEKITETLRLLAAQKQEDYKL